MVKKIIKILFWFIWIGLFVIELVGIIDSIASNDYEDIYTPIILIVLWLIITISVKKIRAKAKKKQVIEKKDEYHKKYITDIVIKDSKFGEMSFEHDSHEGNLVAVLVDLPKFGKHMITELAIGDYDEKNNDLYFRSLDNVYSHVDEIINGCCDMVKECYDDEDIRDSDGNLISMEYIEETLSLEYVYISLNDKGECVVEIHGGMENNISDHINEHGVSAIINCNKNEYEYTSDGFYVPTRYNDF